MRRQLPRHRLPVRRHDARGEELTVIEQNRGTAGRAPASAPRCSSPGAPSTPSSSKEDPAELLDRSHACRRRAFLRRTGSARCSCSPPRPSSPPAAGSRATAENGRPSDARAAVDHPKGADRRAERSPTGRSTSTRRSSRPSRRSSTRRSSTPRRSTTTRSSSARSASRSSPGQDDRARHRRPHRLDGGADGAPRLRASRSTRTTSRTRRTCSPALAEPGVGPGPRASRCRGSRA